MYEKLEICPACKHTQFVNEKIITDFSVSKESFALVSCTKCKLLFTNPRPSVANIGNYYESKDYISHTDNANGFINTIYKIVRSYTLKSKVKLINKYQSPGKLLDFGCGTGDFIQTANRKGWLIQGLEVNEKAREKASSKVNTTIYEDMEQIDKEEKFNVITAWHVLEHVHELLPTIKNLKKRLAKDGTMFIAVPNYRSYDSEVYGEYWAGYDVPRHLYHFSQESMLNLLSKSRLQLIDTIPMKFDSFYVSLLSEKYKGENNSLIRAFTNGLKSNRKAKRTGDYSSLIYVITK